MYMKIDEKIHYSFNDVLIKPAITSIYLKEDVDLVRHIYFPMSKQSWSGIPILLSNTIGTYELYQVLCGYKIITCFHQNYTIDDFKNMDLNPEYFCISTGIEPDDLNRLETICNEINIKFIYIDIENGYHDKIINVCRKIRELYPNKVLIAGNVVCKHRSKELIKKGKIDIVKVGFTSGCFEGNTRILTAHGTYKNIKDMRKGDIVINKDGKPTEVLNLFYRGKKNIMTIKSNNSIHETCVTSDHRFWVGNLDNLSINTVKKGSVTKLLGQNINRDKFKWVEIDKMNYKMHFNLIPKDIQWLCHEELTIDLVEFKSQLQEYDDHYIYIGNEKYKRFIECDELMGNIIGSYLIHRHKIDKIKDYVVQFEIHKDLECHESLVHKFLGSLETTFPKKYYCKNKEFIKGLYKGLLNINEEEFNCSRHTWTIDKNFIELMYFCILALGFYYKINALNKQMTITTHILHDKYHIYSTKKTSNTSNLIDTFDLEVDSPCHSFIANNSCVHNSTRLMYDQCGVGVPQLSAISDCSSCVHDINGFVIGSGSGVHINNISKSMGAGADFIMIEEVLNNCNKKNEEQLELLKNTIEHILDSLKSTCTYVGAKNIQELPEKSYFIHVTKNHIDGHN